MKSIDIQGFAREGKGKKACKDLRNQGFVPCVIYDEGGNIYFYAHENSFNALIFTHEAHFVNLTIDDKKYHLFLQATQYHPVTDKLIHADFMQIYDDKPISIRVPLSVYGDSAAVKAGAKMIVKKRHIKLKGLPANLPEEIKIDISPLNLNQSFRISDLEIENIEILETKSTALVTIAASRGMREAAKENV